eukprot:1488013-Pyramimonas_sp.AAC.2
MAGVLDQDSDGYALLQAGFGDAARAAARAVRAERRQRLADTAKEAEAADAVWNSRKLYSSTRRLTPKPAAPVAAVCNPSSGNMCVAAE